MACRVTCPLFKNYVSKLGGLGGWGPQLWNIHDVTLEGSLRACEEL